jgi:hypothetical protein
MSSQAYANAMRTTGGEELLMLTVFMHFMQGLSGLARCALSGLGKKQENV